jgi:hypothetical protein
MTVFKRRSFIWLPAVLAVACGEAEQSFTIGSQEQGLYVDDLRIWPDFDNIPVCWEATPGVDYTTEQTWARDAVEQSLELYSNIDFTGWGPCTAGARGIHILFRDEGGDSLVGTDLDGQPNALHLNSWRQLAPGDSCDNVNLFTVEQCVRSTAVHEFGHALAFAHEQNRNDTPASCTEPTDSYGTVKIGDWDPNSVMNYCNDVRNGMGLLSVVDTAGLQMYYGTQRIKRYGFDAGGWRAAKHVRVLADVNKDGLADVIGFGNAGVAVAVARGGRYEAPELSFSMPTTWSSAFSYDTAAGGWRVEKHPRLLADVNNDGRADIVGFADDGVYVAVSTGTTFKPAVRWLKEFGYDAGGWRVTDHPRLLADVNKDGKADVVGFANDGVYVALSTGTAFAASTRWIAQFGKDHGWLTSSHIRTLADMNADGRADIVGFGNPGVWVSLSTGTGFAARTLWVSNYGSDPAAGGWNLTANPRFLANVNGVDADGKIRPDIVGFGGSDKVFVSVNNGSTLNPPATWLNPFSEPSGESWDAARHVRTVADVDGDGKADLVGFGEQDVLVSTSTGTGFRAAAKWAPGYGAAQGYGSLPENPRMLAPIDGAKGADIVGFGNDGVHVTSLFIHFAQ